MGIGKRELLEDYYPGEINAIIDEYNKLYDTNRTGGEEEMSGMDFLGGGGELVDA